MAQRRVWRRMEDQPQQVFSCKRERGERVFQLFCGAIVRSGAEEKPELAL